jgi:hypothetical protein
MEKDKLFMLAKHCANLEEDGCNHNCPACQYNVFNYVDDVREASLLKANAQGERYSLNRAIEDLKQKREREESTDFWAKLVGVGIFMGIIAWLFRGC